MFKCNGKELSIFTRGLLVHLDYLKIQVPVLYI